MSIYDRPMVLVPDKERHRVRNLFDTEQVGLVLDAVIAGNAPAWVWADDLAAPRTALAWDGAHSVYLAGAVDRPDVWRELFERDIARAVRGFLKAYVAGDAAPTVFSGYPLLWRERILYSRPHSPIPSWRQLVPTGFGIDEINDRFAGLSLLGNFADVIAEIESTWKSVDDFRRAGFGFVAHDARTIVCWCTAEYVSERRCGIGIETVPSYQGRGFATVTASAFVEHCVHRGMTPYWDAWTSNLPSIAVAEKTGFGKVEAYSILAGDMT